MKVLKKAFNRSHVNAHAALSSSETQIDTERQCIQTHRHRYTDTQTQTHTHTDTDTHTHTHTHTHTFTFFH